MFLPIVCVIVGLALLLWGADRFVDGASSAARHFSIPPLVIGMVIVGFGTSAPEMLVSVVAAIQGNPGLALGNAYGSNIANIGLILGFTALISPIAVHSKILKVELPILTFITLLAAWQVNDGILSQLDAWILLGVFSILMGWTIWQGLRRRTDSLGEEIEAELIAKSRPLMTSLAWVGVGLGLLIVSSRILVWGAVQLASSLGISDMIIGLTVVAVGTSLPELASSLIAVRRGEHDIALGNVLGSNLFNTLAVVGLAGVIMPFECDPETIYRDIPVMLGFTVFLFFAGYGFQAEGRINRWEGAFLLTCFVAYTAVLVRSVLQA